jgi:glyoxylase-like metal-dependent hydrolase (beta-lactamase superfamily II)
MLDRRRLLTGLGGVIGSLAMPRLAFAQQTGVVALTDRLSVVTAGGTNVVALSTPEGLVVVDSGTPESSDRLIASLKTLRSGDRVRALFNTHWHAEHTGANESIRQMGAAIVAHENTRLWMATPTWMPEADRYRPARPKAAQPTETIYTRGSMNAGGERIEYGYLIEAHTSGDIYVFFRDSNVLAVGDVASPARDPELDYTTGAWIGGRADALDRLLSLVDDRTRIVAGFGPPVSRTELRLERDVMKTIYDRTVELVRQGDEVDDMLKAGVMNGLARTWSDPRRFLHAVHKGLWAHHNKLNADVV